MENAPVEIPSLLPALQARGLGPHMDRLIEDLVYENRDSVHRIVDAIIAKRERSAGKGQKSSSGGSSGAPGYTLRDPKVTPSREDIKKSGVYTHRVTRSIVERQKERVAFASTMIATFNVAQKECSEVVDAIIEQCKQRRQLFWDDSFYFDRRDNLYPKGSPDDCTVAEPKAAERLRKLYPTGALFKNEVSVDDVVQGEVGDCFLIGSLAAIAANDTTLLTDIFVRHSVEYGVYGVVFYKQGAWEWVIVDDFVAVKRERNGGAYPLFANSTAEDVEFWPMILEKAYAKLHHNWDCIDGGWAKEALADITGGVEFVLDLYNRNANMTFQAFQELVVDPMTVLCCSVGNQVATSEGQGSAGEAGAAFGLFHGHQYSVVDAKQTTDGASFVKVRNPWGGDAEWKGRYADSSPEWAKNPKHKAELKLQVRDDGIFWMLWEDFRFYFSNIEVVRTFPDHFETLNFYSSAGEVPTDESIFVIHNREGKPVPFTIVVEQDDPKVVNDSVAHAKQKNDPYLQIGLQVARIPCEPKTLEDCLDNMTSTTKAPSQRARNVHLNIDLQPNYSIATVKILGAGDATKKGEFCFRVIGQPADLVVWRLRDGRAQALSSGSSAPSATFTTSVVVSGTPTVAATAASKPASATTGVATVPLERYQREMDETKAYIVKLEQLIQSQQQQMAEMAKKNTARRPLDRLNMDQANFDVVARQVFLEMSRGGTTISQSQALNGLRLLVTLGAGLDDTFTEGCRAAGLTGNLTLPQFSQLCTRAINTWSALS